MRRSARHLLSLALVSNVALAACSGDPSAPGPAAPAQLAGVVTLVGGHPAGATPRHVALYASAQALEELEAPVRQVPLVPLRGDYAFEAVDIPAGTYYVRACFSFGCGEHRTAAGALVGTRVEAARRVAITIAL